MQQEEHQLVSADAEQSEAWRDENENSIICPM